MKESKVIVIVLTSILIILLPILIYSYFISELIYNILISIITGLIVSIITALCQYFVNKSKIKTNIFNCYFDMYKEIYIAEHKKILFHYSVLSIYKKSINFSVELSKNVSEYSDFVSNKKSKLYKKLNPTVYPNYDVFNIRNFTKLCLPFNSKLFNELIIPIKVELEKILRKIDSKKFDKNLKEFIIIYNNLNCKK